MASAADADAGTPSVANPAPPTPNGTAVGAGSASSAPSPSPPSTTKPEADAKPAPDPDSAETVAAAGTANEPDLSSVITQVAPETATSGVSQTSALREAQKKAAIQATPPAPSPPTIAPATQTSRPPPAAPAPSGAAAAPKPRAAPRSNGGFFASLFSCCTCGSAEDFEPEPRPVATNPGLGTRVDGLAAAPAKAEAEGIQSVRAAEATTTNQNDAATVVVETNGTQPAQPERKWLLRPLGSQDRGKKCLVLDLDETLVHSSFKAIPHADYVIPVEIESQVHNVYVLKRPYVDPFLKRMSEIYEIVVFTASLAKYADPVLDILDKYKVVNHRLFREACIHHKGNYVKDLSMLGRDLRSVIIIDNSPASYMFHTTNAIPITSWFNDVNDTELLDLIPFLEDLNKCDNVQLILDQTTSE